MHPKGSAISLASILLAFVFAAVPQLATGADTPALQPKTSGKPVPPAKANPSSPAPATSITVIDAAAARAVLGRPVLGSDNKSMGRIVDIVVDLKGHVRAAIIDFGGFLGVGSRKIAVDWNALHFSRAVKRGDEVSLALTRDQLKAAPEYKEGKPLVVIGAAGDLRPLNFPPTTNPEK